ncbi:MAG TPA: xanthine dehydrogenase family protein molybdopterin-binding subunit [Gemmatimonadales bacterium]
MRELIGSPMDRVDGRLKVTGAALYATEMPVDRVTYGALVTSSIASGRIARIDRSSIASLPGVLLVMTHENAPRLPSLTPPGGGRSSQDRALSLLQDDAVHYNGEPIGVVVADTFEHATDAAHRLEVSYAPATPALDLAVEIGRAYPAPVNPAAQGGRSGAAPHVHGDSTAALATAPVTHAARYTTPMEYHNSMEPHCAITFWTAGTNGDELMVYDTTQYVAGARATLAKRFGIGQDRVRVVSHFVGGAFGSKGAVWSHLILAAMAARQLGRPVKLSCTRRQQFGPVGGRPATIQDIALAADRDGRLTAIRHSCISTTAVMEDWVENATAPTKMLYASPAIDTKQQLVALNVGVPTYQRAPGESTGTFALESAMDELAYALRIDPVALRLTDYAEKDPETGQAWSSKALKECYRVGAERFGWSKRSMSPRSTRDGNHLVGWGMATATYPARSVPASASCTLFPAARNGVRAVLEAATHDLGTGTYTILMQIVAEVLGLDPAQVAVKIGDSNLPLNPISAGSLTAASTGPAVYEAATALRDKLINLAIADQKSPLYQATPVDVVVTNAGLSVKGNAKRSDSFAAILARKGASPIEANATWTPPPSRNRYSTHAFGAVFAEARVDADLGEVRISRVVGVYGARPLNRKTATSQLMGGIVWAIGMALTEEALLDVRSGRIVNADLAEYHVPVNADVGNIDVQIIDEPDSIVNPIGVKGLGEIGITGANAAIANAVYHATGVRVRDLPITPDKVLRGSV